MEALFIISLVIYILDIIVLFYYGIHCFVMVRLFFKYRKNCVSDQSKLDDLQKRMKTWPKVTIQLPMFNEYYVAERLIDTTMQVRYPKNKLEVQVLDDKNVRRRFRASNYQSTTRVKPFICTMPMRLD